MKATSFGLSGLRTSPTSGSPDAAVARPATMNSPTSATASRGRARRCFIFPLPFPCLDCRTWLSASTGALPSTPKREDQQPGRRASRAPGRPRASGHRRTAVATDETDHLGRLTSKALEQQETEEHRDREAE